MGLSHAPRVITDGIVLGLDAANTRSYVGSGTTWTDLIGSNNGTLTNGPVFTQEPKLEPFGGAGAVSFDGSGDNLNFTNIDVGTGDFTYEGWIYPTGASLIPLIIWHNGTSKVHTFGLCSDSNANNSRSMFGANARPVASNSWIVSSAISVNTWHHIAFVRVSGTLKIYVDGTEQSTSAGSGSTGGDPSSYSTDVSYIGSNANSSEYFVGRISNARVISGTALYTSNFTPPSRTLEPIENTVLLTCQGQNIKDASSNSHAITVNGDAKATIVSSSFEFDGSDDYVILSNFDKASYGTTNFSLSLWFNADSGSYKSLFQAASALSNTNPWIALISYSSGLRVYVNANYRIDVPYTQGAWNNFVLTFDSAGSGLWTAYLNGSSVGSYTGPIGNFSASGTYLGNAYNNSYFDGKISNFSVQQKTLTASEIQQNYNATKGRYA